MNLREQLLLEHSKTNSELITKWIGKNKARFGGLMQLFLHDEYRVVQRAAWVLSMVAEEHMDIVQQHLAAMVHRMAEPGVHVAVKRNVVRVLQWIDIPEELQGEVMNVCFDLLADPKETVAVRCFSMTVLGNLAQHYPEIKPELRIIIEDQLEQQPTAGFKARARKVLAGL